MNPLKFTTVQKLSNNQEQLADQFLPTYQFSERHLSTPIASTPSIILHQIGAYDDQGDAVLNTLLTIRELPSRLYAKLGSRNDLSNRGRFGFSDFQLLQRTDTEVAYGLVGHFWKLDYGLIQLNSPHEFMGEKCKAMPKLVMSFTVTPAQGQSYQLLTETRVYCPSRWSAAKFLPYWVTIRFFSGWIRQRILKRVKEAAEA